MRLACLVHPSALHLIILITADEKQSHGSFQALTGVLDQSMVFFWVYTPCVGRVLRCFGGKPASIFMVAVWIALLLKWLEKGVCQSYGKAGGNLAFFRLLQYPRDSYCHPEGEGSTFLQNVGTHKYHKAYKSARRPPTEKKPMNFHIIKFSPPPCYFLPIRSRHSLEHFSHMPCHTQVTDLWNTQYM